MALSVLASIATDGLQALVCRNSLVRFQRWPLYLSLVVVRTQCIVWFEMHKVVTMKNIVLWNATPYSLVEIYRYFGESAAFILIPEHGSLEHAQNKHILIHLSALSFWRSTIKVAILWHVYPCCSVDRYHRFRGIPCCHSVTLKMEAANPLQTMVRIYQFIRRHIPEDSIIVQVSTSFWNGSGQLTKRSWAVVVWINVCALLT